MLDNRMLLEAIGGVRPEYVLDAGCVLGYGPAKIRKRHKNIWRTVLLAAVIATLLGVTVYALGLFGMKDRQVEMPANSAGEVRYAYIPNGFKGSPTYLGSAEWWEYKVLREDENGGHVLTIDTSFIKDNDTLRKTAELYNVHDQEMLDKLLEISKKYNLKLYTEAVSAEGLESLYKFSGVDPFMDNLEPIYSNDNSCIYADGSFNYEFCVDYDGLNLICTISKIRSGSIYPYGGAILGNDWDEYLYYTAKGYDVAIATSHNTFRESVCISYADDTQDSFIELYYTFQGKELEKAGVDEIQMREGLADRLDFAALCKNNDVADELINVPRGVEDNRDSLQVLLDFQSSNVYQADREFQEFFTATFYDPYFKGTYGMDGYADIDGKLDELADKYGLTYATSKSMGNQFYDNATVFDNGAWYATMKGNESSSIYRIEYIPKDALYTGLLSLLDFNEYQRVWPYVTSMGERVIIFTEGPEKEQSPGMLYENEDAYVLVTHGSRNPAYIEDLAETINWSQLYLGGRS